MTCDNLRRCRASVPHWRFDGRALRFLSTAPIANVSPYEVAVGLRYTRARKGSGRNTFISFIALISMAGIALGVAALIVVLSVMNGFQHELRNRILSVASHVEIRGFPGPEGSAAAVAAAARKNPHVVAHGAVRQRPGDARVGRRQSRRAAARHRSGAGSEGRRHRHCTCARGTLDSLTPGSFNIVLGTELARALGVRVGDSVVVDHAAGQRSRRPARCRASRASR